MMIFCLPLLSILGVKVNDLLTSADSTRTCPGATKSCTFAYGSCPSLLNTVHICGARLVSLIIFSSVF